jgi:hypothetical protein
MVSSPINVGLILFKKPTVLAEVFCQFLFSLPPKQMLGNASNMLFFHILLSSRFSHTSIERYTSIIFEVEKNVITSMNLEEWSEK